MLVNTNEFVKTVSASSAEDFDNKINTALKEFSKKGIRYELQIAPELGFTAFIRYKVNTRIAENVADEFELGGEQHTCIECPYFIRPTDGRVKHSRCDVTQGIHRAESPCCEAFYQKLLAGEIDLVEVVKIGKKKL